MKSQRTTLTVIAILAALIFLTPLNAQQNTYPITGYGFYNATYPGMGSWASGGPFRYTANLHDYSLWGQYCTIGQPCTVNARIPIVPVDWHTMRWILNSTLGDKWTPSIRADVQIVVSPFITPAPPSGAFRYSIQMPARVNGTVSALYFDHANRTEWEVWNATLDGNGTAEIQLMNDYGSEVWVFGVSLPYTGTASVKLGTPFINAPDPDPTGIAYANDSLFVSNIAWSGLATITQIDPKNGAVMRSLLAPSETGFDGRGTPSDLAYVRGHLFVSDVGTAGAGRVYEIAPDATKLYNTYSLPFRGGAIGTDGTRLFVGDLDSSSMLIFAGPQQLRRPLANGLRPAGMVFDTANNVLWAIDQVKTGLISQLTTKGELLRTCAAPWSIGDLGLGGVALSGSKLWIAEITGFDEAAHSGRPGTISIADTTKLTCSPALPTTVRLDVKPDSVPNVINPQSNGVLPVAILSTASFDAATINPTTLRFGETGKEAAPDHWAIADVNHDGRSDLMVHFRTAATGLSCGISFASVSGRTYKAQEIRGTDSVTLLGCK